MKTKSLPKGKRIDYEDQLVKVYSNIGEVVYQGLFDYCPYKDEDYRWNEKGSCYDLPQGYKMIGL